MKELKNNRYMKIVFNACKGVRTDGNLSGAYFLDTDIHRLNFVKNSNNSILLPFNCLDIKISFKEVSNSIVSQLPQI